MRVRQNDDLITDRGGHQSFVVMASIVKDVKPWRCRSKASACTATGLSELQDQKDDANRDE